MRQRQLACSRSAVAAGFLLGLCATQLHSGLDRVRRSHSLHHRAAYPDYDNDGMLMNTGTTHARTYMHACHDLVGSFIQEPRTDLQQGTSFL